MSSTNSPDEKNKGHSNGVNETRDIHSIKNNKVRDRVKEKKKEEEPDSPSTVPAEE